MQDHASLNEKSKTNPVVSFDIKEELLRYLSYWKWIALSVAVFLIGAMIYLRYTTPKYSASATILVKDDRKGSLNSELSAFEDLAMGKGYKSYVDNEVKIITSRTVMENAVVRLGLTVSYFNEGRVRTTELYDTAPVTITVVKADSTFLNKRGQLGIHGRNASEFELLSGAGESLGTFRYNTPLTYHKNRIIIQKNPAPNRFLEKYEIKVVFSRLKDVVGRYRANFEANTTGRNSSVVELSLSDPVPGKAEDLLDMIVQVYNEDAIQDKNYISARTEEFINERLDLISGQLGDVEKDVEQYKASRGIVDITAQSGLYLQNAVTFEKALVDVGTQISIAQAMKEFMEKYSKDELAPVNLIASTQGASDLISTYNQAILQRKKLLKDGKETNNAVSIVNKTIEELRANILQSLETQLDALAISRRDLERQNNMAIGKISQVPKQEREYRGIERQQKIKEALYLYLLQKREEIAISLKVTPPNAKVIDSAMASDAPIAPKKNIIYLAALGAGLLLPLGIIYLLLMLDSKVRRRQDIEAVIDIPFLGNIPRFEDPSRIVDERDRSGAAEAIRIVRTNLEFMLTAKTSPGAKTLFVTSTLPKEGKTSMAINLASTIALSGKRVLLMGLDIRNPKIQNYIPVPAKGFTNYISQPGADLDDFIVPVEGHENLFVMPSGVIPPNPVELLMNERVAQTFNELKERYDYLVVDTAPVSLVTDTLLIAKQADVSIFVIRANFFEKRMLGLVQKFYQEKKLPNMAVLLNDTVKGNSYGYGSYGYGDYGYGYSQTAVKAKPWWKRLFS